MFSKLGVQFLGLYLGHYYHSTFKLSVTLSNLKRFSQKNSLIKFVTKPHYSNDLTLGMLLHYFFENRLRFEVKASLKVETFWDTVIQGV